MHEIPSFKVKPCSIRFHKREKKLKKPSILLKFQKLHKLHMFHEPIHPFYDSKDVKINLPFPLRVVYKNFFAEEKVKNRLKNSALNFVNRKKFCPEYRE